MNAVYIERMETLKTEISEAIESGIYASLPADEFGIIPQTRLLWGIDSVNYIAEVGKNLEDIDRHILNALEQTDCGNPDKVVLAICRSIEAQSGDCFVTEGIGNIRWVFAILGPYVDVVERSRKRVLPRLFKPKQTIEEIEDENRYLLITAEMLERQIEENEKRVRDARKEITRLRMLIEHIESKGKKQRWPAYPR